MKRIARAGNRGFSGEHALELKAWGAEVEEQSHWTPRRGEILCQLPDVTIRDEGSRLDFDQKASKAFEVGPERAQAFATIPDWNRNLPLMRDSVFTKLDGKSTLVGEFQKTGA